MTHLYRSRDGRYTVEVVQLSVTPNRQDGKRIRLKFCGYYVADVRSVAELSEHVDLADLEEA